VQIRGFDIMAIAFALAVGCSPSVEQNDGGGDSGSAACAAIHVDDADGDGISDQDEGRDASVDTDGDGTPDFRDTDSDDDGWTDDLESGMTDCVGPPFDSDGDDTPDFRDTDSDGNGIPDSDESDDDLDDDGLPNWRDVDDDGDDISDAIELGDDPSRPSDADGDGVPDWHDPDSDNDTIPDRLEGDDDLDGDGLGNFRDTDSDGDGWSDSEEYGAAPGEAPVDTDGDGAPDFRDTDSDNDQLDDADERTYGTLRTEADTDGDGFTDYQEISQDTDPLDGNDYPRPDPCNPSECQPSELCGETGSGDGLDNDCNGQIDEICPCSPGETRPCFLGRPSERGVGVCTDGLLTCDEFGGWSDCAGGVAPQLEICDGADNDCDGLFDEELSDCESPLTCPGTMNAAPLTTIELKGGDIYDGAYDSWTWEVFCPMTVDSCPMPADASARDTSVYVIQSGAYRMRATIVVGEDTYTCEFTVQVQGDGLRVELLWDTQGSAHGNTDVDLHLHRPGTDTAWFDSNDDCYYSNCTAYDEIGSRPDWGYDPTTDTSVCDEAPHGHGDRWAALGYCANPRLDVDIINCDSSDTDSTSSSFCSPENINVDNPGLGDTFRIMVNYYSEHSYSGITHPTVNIYCGGALRATFGEGDVELVVGSSYGSSNDNWLVADVQFFVDECGGVDCRISPILNAEEGPWVETGPAFGPPWSF